MAGAMSNERKRRLSDRAKGEADLMACPVCKRRAAMVVRQMGERFYAWCQWIDRGRCQSTPENDSRPDAWTS